MTTITELKKLLFSMILKTPIWLVHLAANQSSVMSIPIMWFKMFTSCVLFDQACQTRQNSGGLQRASQDLTKGGLQYFLKILRNENFTF